MKQFLKDVVGVILLPTILVSTFYLLINYAEQQIFQKEITNLRGKLLSETMSFHETTLGICYPNRPRIMITDCNGFTGLYSPLEDTIEIDVYAILSGKARSSLSHELGHFYADKLSEQIGKGNFPCYDNSPTLPEKVCLRLISEGIAEYFERTTHPKQDTFKNNQWPLNSDDFRNNYVLYEGGYHLVKPIIDAHKKQGIQYLILNPPTPDDLKDVQKYQKRLLEELAQQ